MVQTFFTVFHFMITKADHYRSAVAFHLLCIQDIRKNTDIAIVDIVIRLIFKLQDLVTYPEDLVAMAQFLFLRGIWIQFHLQCII